MEYLIPLIAGFTLGCIHTFDVDHIVAVTAFASKHPSPRGAAKFGLLWGFGHTTTLLVLGLLSLGLKLVIPPLVQSLAELSVGILLVVIGMWVLRDLFRSKHIHIHKHLHDGVEHFHVHSHRHDSSHRHQHSIFLIGATHGFAGTASVMILIPITITQSLLAAGIYLLLFGVGTIAAMGIFAYFLGKLSSTTAAERMLPMFQGAAGTASIVIGTMWIGHQVL